MLISFNWRVSESNNGSDETRSFFINVGTSSIRRFFYLLCCKAAGIKNDLVRIDKTRWFQT